jgi:endonuclease/exonuclease/phosphatase family metal-dependent hydrolase
MNSRPRPRRSRGAAAARQPRPAPRADAIPLRVLTINTHKGLSPWNRRFMLAELREAVRSTAADLVFLQEVIGEKLDQAAIAVPHYEFLADELWPQFAYGRNAVNPRGHHGNALLSRHPIVSWRNHDVSVSGPEPRGLLHCTVQLGGARELHAVCVHLGLRESHRAEQLRALCRLVADEVPPDAPLVVAGDFNDWRERAGDVLEGGCSLQSAFACLGARCPLTFPARWPLVPLDRIYVRGLDVHSACVLSTLPWPHLSDHLPLLAEVHA